MIDHMESAVEEKSHFDRLPTELIFSILDRISTARVLIIPNGPKLFDMVSQSKKVELELAGPTPSGPDWAPGALQFLKGFASTIEEVEIKLETATDDPPVWWSLGDEGFVLLHASEAVPSKAFKGFSVDVQREIPDEQFASHRARFRACADRARAYLAYAGDVITTVPAVQRVTVEDGSGRVVVSREAIARKSLRVPAVADHRPPPTPTDTCHSISGLWYAPVAVVPGCMLKDATLVNSYAMHSRHCRVYRRGTVPHPLVDEVWNELAAHHLAEEMPTDFYAGRFEDYRFRRSPNWVYSILSTR